MPDAFLRSSFIFFVKRKLTMKQTLLTRLVLGAIAGIAAAGVANAGQITASSTNVAREVITNDVQTIDSPTISYRFSGDINATAQIQEFQVQFKLGNGAVWASLPSDNAFTITPTAGTDAGLAGVGATDFVVFSKAIDVADPSVLWATIRVPVVPTGVWVDSLLDQPIVTLNAPTATTKATIKKLYTLVGDLVADYNGSGKCSDNKSLSVDFKHFKLLSNPSAIAATGSNGIADEHERAGSTNSAGIINFPTNIKVNVTPSTYRAILTPGGNTTFTAAAGAVGNSFIDADTVMLGQVALAQNANGYDSNLTNQYALAGVVGGGSGAGLDDVTVAGNNIGDVEVNTVSVAIAATQGFVVGGSLYASLSAVCAAGALNAATLTPVTALNAAGPITVTIPNTSVEAAFGVAGTGPVYLCYDAPGAVTIPSSAFSAVGRVNKAAAGANLNEQDNICNGNFYSLGGGIKIDVRNYASSKETSGYSSVIRLINNSDARTADVYAQLIHQDGKLGAWGKLTDLAPRAILNMTAAQVEALLTNAPNAGAANGASAAAADVKGAPRLRITSNSGASLRVQNYLFNSATGQILEASGTQAVDFEGTTTRAPAFEGQYQSQDANSGLNLAP